MEKFQEKKTVLIKKTTLWFFVILIALIFLLLFTLYLYSQHLQNKTNSVDLNSTANQTDQTTNTDNSTSRLNWAQDCEVQGRVQLTHSPMNLTDVSSIIPLGLVAGAHVTPIDHLYFSPADFNSPRDAYPVYAMGDGYLIEVQVRRIMVDTGKSRDPEYRLVFQHSCQTISYFDLVTSLESSLLEKIPNLKTQDYSGIIRIPIKAGELIGRIGGQTLDTAVYNLDLELPGFISPELYEAEAWKIHTDDFFSYFNEPLKSQLLALNWREAEPRSGKIDYDQPGKLIGNWFKEGTNGYAGASNYGSSGGGNNYWSGHLAIFYNHIRPENIVISIGDFEGQPAQFFIKGNAPDPAEIGISSGIVKYELIPAQNYIYKTDLTTFNSNQPVQGTVLFQVLPDEKLKMEIFSRKAGSEIQSFTSNAQIFER